MANIMTMNIFLNSSNIYEVAYVIKLIGTSFCKKKGKTLKGQNTLNTKKINKDRIKKCSNPDSLKKKEFS
jgi:hypothetical protein